MSLKEVDRLRILEQIISKNITQKEAAQVIGISKRQMIRVFKDFVKYGPISVISKKRGKASNNRLPDAIRDIVRQIIKEKYHDFGPTLAHEKLVEVHEINIGLESVRKIMIGSGLWKRRSRRCITPHQMRVRRPQRGELIQIDGSPHRWFENRGEYCCLLLAIDDATGEVMAARFVKTETTEGYFDLMRDYISRHGRPRELYSDKHGIFRVNTPEAQSGTGETQFGRAMRELGIKTQCASTAQAKGRVERMNKTMQDRLVKEMRLLGISDMSTGNAFIPKVVAQFKRKFAVMPASPIDAHRPELPTADELDLIFSLQCVRKLSKSLELQYHNITYQIQIKTPSYVMRGASVKVCDRNGRVRLFYKGRELSYKIFDNNNKPQEVLSAKDIAYQFDRRGLGHKPKDTHPWKNSYTETLVAVKNEHLPTAFKKQSGSYGPTAF